VTNAARQALDESLAGCRAIAPILLSVVPFALVSGVAAVGAGLPTAPAIAMASIVFAGSSQLVAVSLIGGGAPAAVVLLSAFVVNLRFAMYSASLAPHLARLRPAEKWMGAYLLTDQAYAVSMDRFGEREVTREGAWFYLGAGVIMWLTWQVGSAVGVLLGAQLPASWSLDFTVALSFIALLVPLMKDRAAVLAAVAAGGAAVALVALPLRLGLVCSALVGIAVGFVVERGSERRRASASPGVAGAVEERSRA
jgi:predicted branched-subunit amino acid permease